jgi:hypothetical protein
MKVAFVVGFYDRMFKTIAEVYSSLLEEQRLIWIATVAPHGDGDWRNLKELLVDRLAAGATSVFLFVVIRRGREEDFGKRISDIIAAAKERYPNVIIDLKSFRYALDEKVLFDLSAFLETVECEAYPDSLNDLEGWCCRELDEKLLLLPRAIDAARKAAYQDIALVYQSLKLLGEEYREMRLKGGAAEQSDSKAN